MERKQRRKSRDEKPVLGHAFNRCMTVIFQQQFCCRMGSYLKEQFILVAILEPTIPGWLFYNIGKAIQGYYPF